jgi:hypothetical protein
MATLVDLGSGERIGRVDEQVVARGIPEWVRPPREGGWTDAVALSEAGIRQIRPDGIVLLAAWPHRDLLPDNPDEIQGEDLDDTLRQRIRMRRETGGPAPGLT